MRLLSRGPMGMMRNISWLSCSASSSSSPVALQLFPEALPFCLAPGAGRSNDLPNAHFVCRVCKPNCLYLQPELCVNLLPLSLEGGVGHFGMVLATIASNTLVSRQCPDALLLVVTLMLAHAAATHGIADFETRRRPHKAHDLVMYLLVL